jgi:hypothetical protein
VAAEAAGCLFAVLLVLLAKLCLYLPITPKTMVIPQLSFKLLLLLPVAVLLCHLLGYHAAAALVPGVAAVRPPSTPTVAVIIAATAMAIA